MARGLPVKIEGFIIHLQRARTRRPQVDHLLDALPVKTRVLDAVDGQTLGESDIVRYYARDLHEPAYPFALRQTEIACFLSHRKAWRMIVEQGLDAGLIVEDDVAIDAPLFRRCLEVAKTVCEGKAYVQFQTRRIVGPYRVLAGKDGIKIVCPAVAPLRTSAQLVSREAALELLALSERLDRPVDTFIQMRWVTGIAPLCVVPSGASDRTRQTGGSTIQASKALWERVSREYRRFSYRRAVQRLSRSRKRMPIDRC